jgi:hypothetical protein
MVLFSCCLAFALGQPEGRVVAAPTQEKPQTKSLADRLVGTWHLISVETIRSNGELIYPFYGRHPEGMLIYDRDGWMSVQIVSDPKPSVPTDSSRENFMTAKPAEKAIAVDGYYAYCGTWTADSSASSVTHHIQQSLYPGERGQTVVRQVVLDENRLILTAKTHEMGEDHERRLVWERSKEASH